ncbi:hypothetical protein D1BOALGB6SA_3610 [Olavius sp. associated proteobacterium Delta 1]|nr:hypothetical protein D1BOALGB6SA_3610 [Olavius sp. associated proteobacterium Delta 1]
MVFYDDILFSEESAISVFSMNYLRIISLIFMKKQYLLI